ncbi:hypothetical protein BCR44DRAFT_1432999 [Catenaria anguillulae PL171]|uniref:Uncharacterized protein n=1 Tax=Catenaria anguillulae PL171 TaxID=765915 RepID=A0A1Y2HNQ4_9FUNG|nr:hypothetical protein BCR44DRAFT_1432999 [Catenaria anguillulae PL171]
MLPPPMPAPSYAAARPAIPVTISCVSPGTSEGTGTGGTAVTSVNAGTGKKLQRKRKRWTKEEEGFLWAGVQKHGVGAWSVILADAEYTFDPQRTAVDLKDKWRVLTVRRPPTAPPPPIDPSTLPRAPPPNKRAREVSPERTNRTIAVAAIISPAAESHSPPLPTPTPSSLGGRTSQPESRKQSPAAAAEQEVRGRSRSRSSSLSPLPPASVWSSIQSDWSASFSALPPPDTWLTGPVCSLLPDDLRSASMDPLFSSGRVAAASPTSPQPQPTQPPPQTFTSPSSAVSATAAPMCPFAARLTSASAPDVVETSSDLTHEFEYHDYSADESDDDSGNDNQWSMPAMARGEALFPFANSPVGNPDQPFSSTAAESQDSDRLHTPATSARFFGAFNPPPTAPPPATPPTDSRTALKAELTDAITRARIAGDELKAHHESIVLKLMTSSGRSVQHVSPIASPRLRPLDARPLARAVVTANDPVHAAMAKASASASGRKRGRSEPAPVARRRVISSARRSGAEHMGQALIPHAISEATDLALAEMLDAALQLDESTRTAALRLLGNRAFARNSSRLESLAFRALRLTTTDILRMGMHPSEATLPDDPVAAAAAVKPSEHMYARIKKGHSHMQAKLLQAAAANGSRALTN